jgi:hypothetical protein
MWCRFAETHARKDSVCKYYRYPSVRRIPAYVSKHRVLGRVLLKSRVERVIIYRETNSTNPDHSISDDNADGIAVHSQWRITICSKLCLNTLARRRASDMICAAPTPRRDNQEISTSHLGLLGENGGAKVGGPEMNGPAGLLPLAFLCFLPSSLCGLHFPCRPPAILCLAMSSLPNGLPDSDYR